MWTPRNIIPPPQKKRRIKGNWPPIPNLYILTFIIILKSKFYFIDLDPPPPETRNTHSLIWKDWDGAGLISNPCSEINVYNNWLYIGGHTLLYFMSPSSGMNSGLIESMYNCMIRQWWIISGRSAFHMHQERNGRTSGFTLSLSLLDFYCRDCRMGVIELAWSQYKIIWFESYASVIYFALF